MLTKTSCYSAVDIVISVMDYDVETVLVNVLEQDCQACYNAVRIAGSVLNTNSWYCVLLNWPLLNIAGPIL